MIGAAVWTAGPILLAYGITIGSCKETNPPKYNAEAFDGFSNLHYGTGDLGSTGNGIWVASDGPGIASSGVCFRVSSVINYDANTGPIENQVEAGWYRSGYGAPDPAGACVAETAKPYAFMNYLYNDGTGDSCVDGTGLAANEGTHVFFKVWDQSSSGNTDQTWDAYVSTSETPTGPWQGLTAGSSYEMTNGARCRTERSDVRRPIPIGCRCTIQARGCKSMSGLSRLTTPSNQSSTHSRLQPPSLELGNWCRSGIPRRRLCRRLGAPTR